MIPLFSLYVILLFFLANSPHLHAQKVIWRPVLDSEGQFIWDIDCADSMHCLYPGEVGIGIESYVMLTTDGGHTWSKSYRELPDNPDRRYPLHVLEAEYVTPRLALVSADSGYVLRTSDGGQSWELREVTNDRRALRGPIEMYDSLNGILVLKAPGGPDSIPDRLMKTTDGGLTWDSVETAPRTTGWELRAFDEIACTGPQTYHVLMTAMLGGSPGAQLFAKTTDGGKNWRFVDSPLPLTQWYRNTTMNFFDEQNAIITGVLGGSTVNGLVAKTTDGGSHWEILSQGKIENNYGGMYHSSFYNELHGIAGVLGGIVRTTDGGYTWRYDSIDYPPNRLLGFYVAAPTTGTGIGVASVGVVVRTDQSSSVGNDRNDNRAIGLQLSPVPARKGTEAVLDIRLMERTLITVSVVDVSGAAVQHIEPQSLLPGRWELSIPTSDLSAGSYLVVVTAGDSEHVEKLIVVD